MYGTYEENDNYHVGSLMWILGLNWRLDVGENSYYFSETNVIGSSDKSILILSNDEYLKRTKTCYIKNKNYYSCMTAQNRNIEIIFFNIVIMFVVFFLIICVLQKKSMIKPARPINNSVIIRSEQSNIEVVRVIDKKEVDTSLDVPSWDSNTTSNFTNIKSEEKYNSEDIV